MTVPTKDPKQSSYTGEKLFDIGVLDKYVGLTALFGTAGHSHIGFSADRWQGMKWPDDKDAVMADLEGFRHPEMTDAEWDRACTVAGGDNSRRF